VDPSTLFSGIAIGWIAGWTFLYLLWRHNRRASK
jgi:hypothetical protein